MVDLTSPGGQEIKKITSFSLAGDVWVNVKYCHQISKQSHTEKNTLVAWKGQNRECPHEWKSSEGTTIISYHVFQAYHRAS
jgi:hypothetical protein